MPLESGMHLGPYEILSQLGAGGMGEVYRARDTRLNRTVAIKVLLALLSDRSDLRQRLEWEARAVASHAPRKGLGRGKARGFGLPPILFSQCTGSSMSQCQCQSS